jgi:hypothetical protein
MSAVDNIHVVARALGGDAANRTAVVCPGPGHSARDRSLSVTLDDRAPDGFVVNSFANDDWLACRDHVRERLGPFHRGAARPTVPTPAKQLPTPPTSKALRRAEFALSLWLDAKPIRGTLAERYLTSRHIVIDDDVYSGQALRSTLRVRSVSIAVRRSACRPCSGR